jgi:diadenosine tetraphosphate (Ap4A) HIT family hydrolase
MQSCPFCLPLLTQENNIVLENDLCLFLQLAPSSILTGSGIVIPRAHRETVFDLMPEEWQATHSLLLAAKRLIDQQSAPDGYNVGWNCGRVGGQEVFHVHMHIIPRYKDEPYAGRGIRYWLKQDSNRRPE